MFVRNGTYRRQYDDNVDFTFYVDHDYKVVDLFEGWINYILDKVMVRDSVTLMQKRANFRMNYPNSYLTNMYILKFEKDVSSSSNIF